MPNYLSRLRRGACKKQRGLCYYCGFPMVAKLPACSSHESKRFQCTAEHLIPKSRGGRVSADNIVAACRFCNESRASMKSVLIPQKFRAHVRKQLSKGQWHPIGQERFGARCSKGRGLTVQLVRKHQTPQKATQNNRAAAGFQHRAE